MNCVWCESPLPESPRSRGRKRRYCKRRCANEAAWARRSGNGRTGPLPDRICEGCGGSFRPRQENQRVCSDRCYRKRHNASYRGSRNMNYYRTAFIEERGSRCQECGVGGDLEIHHRVPVSLGGDDCAANLVVLCRGCHMAADQSAGVRRVARSPVVPVEIREPRERRVIPDIPGVVRGSEVRPVRRMVEQPRPLVQKKA